jgi:hypothetical protein
MAVAGCGNCHSCPRSHHHRADMADSLASATPATPTAGAGARKRKAEQTPETDTEERSRRRARQSMRVDLVAAAALACSVLASLALALHAATSGPRHGSFQALISLTRRHLSSACHARFVTCSAPVFCAWRRLPLLIICLKLQALGRCVCTRQVCCVCFCMSHFYCSSVELLPLGWHAVAFPWWGWLHVQVMQNGPYNM